MDKYFNIIEKKVNNEYSIEKNNNNNNKIIIINDNLNTRLSVIHTRYSVSAITHIHTCLNPIRSGGGGALKAPPSDFLLSCI